MDININLDNTALFFVVVWSLAFAGILTAFFHIYRNTR